MSSNNVQPIPRKIQFKGLLKSYPLVERANTELAPENLDVEIRHCYPPPNDTEFQVSTLTQPNSNSFLFAEYDTADLSFHNALLAYRMLKLLYGLPVPLAARCRVEKNTRIHSPFGMEWGYLLEIDDHLSGEVRSVLSNARLVIRFWLDHEPNEDEKPLIIKKASKFLDDYQDSIQKNAHLFSEEKDLPKDRLSASPGVMNVFAQNYRAAEELLEMAELKESPTPERYLSWQPDISVETYGSLYASSAIQFFSALEALINTVLTLKLKDEFRADHYERVTVRADLDVRLMTAHLFCHGFDKQIVTPKSEVWKRLLKLRDFRNTIVHGNITEEHYLYTLIEDNNVFYYGPSFDYRGRKREVADTNKYPTTMSAIRSDTVNDIKRTVDLVVSAILEASDKETRQWLNSWIQRPFISPDVARILNRLVAQNLS